MASARFLDGFQEEIKDSERNPSIEAVRGTLWALKEMLMQAADDAVLYESMLTMLAGFAVLALRDCQPTQTDCSPFRRSSRMENSG